MNDIENQNPLENNLLDNNANEPQAQSDNDAQNAEVELASNAFTIQFLMYEMQFNPLSNLIAMFIALSKVGASSAVLATNNLCFNVFQNLIILMLIHDVFNLLLKISMSISVFRANRTVTSDAPRNGEDLNSVQREVELNLQRRRAVQNLTKMLKFGLGVSKYLDILYFFLFFSANICYFLFVNHRSCPNENEQNLLLALLILGHLWFLGPLSLLIILGIFSPIIPPILNCIRKRKEQKKFRLLNKLKVKKFSDTLPGTHECSICILEYENNDDIVQLKCNPLHHFHDECIKPWLKANGKCPLCRMSLEDMYK